MRTFSILCCGALAVQAAPEPTLREQLLAAGRGLDAAYDAAAMEMIQATLGPLELPAAPPGPEEARATCDRDMQPYRESIPGSKVTFELRPIPSGSFSLGSPATEAGRNTDEGPQVRVAVDAFWMGRCEVTWVEYDTWASALARESDREVPSGADAIATPSIGYVDMSQGMGRGRRPAAGMSQLAAKLYCRWLTMRTGRFYRLPTEAEWEYACRAGSTNAYGFGEDASQLGDYTWFEENSDLSAQPVGLKQTNAWGLCDLHGNLAEWVLDAYTPGGYASRTSAHTADQPIPPVDIDPRCVRGGSFDDPAQRLRSAARRGSSEAWRASDPNLPKSIWWVRDAPFVGFRVVRPLRAPEAAVLRACDLDEAQLRQLAEKLGWLKLITRAK